MHGLANPEFRNFDVFSDITYLYIKSISPEEIFVLEVEIYSL
jgi:hypothetical protein